MSNYTKNTAYTHSMSMNKFYLEKWVNGLEGELTLDEMYTILTDVAWDIQLKKNGKKITAENDNLEVIHNQSTREKHKNKYSKRVRH